MIALQALVVSSDEQVCGLIARIFGKLGVEVDQSSSGEDASEKFATRKYDAVIVDCDDLLGGAELLRHLRRASSNRSAVAFAIINGVTSVRAAFDLGANFVLDKPLSAERIGRSLRSAQGMMARERRRYFREPVEMPVSITLQSGSEVPAMAANVSEGGMALRSAHPLSSNVPMRVRFTLPGTRVSVEARAELAWTDVDGQIGIRFQHIHQSSREHMEQWLAERMERYDPSPLDSSAPTRRRYGAE